VWLVLGCGDRPVEGAVNHDRTAHRAEVDVVWDLNNYPWPWGNDAFDHIHADAVLEHLRLDLTYSMGECWRILRPRGTLYLKLPYWRHETSWRDITHYWKFALDSLDHFVPGTEVGDRYKFYVDRPWSYVRRPRLNPAKSSIIAELEAIK
jgi:SAM-dependent methyltransferase